MVAERLDTCYHCLFLTEPPCDEALTGPPPRARRRGGRRHRLRRRQAGAAVQTARRGWRRRARTRRYVRRHRSLHGRHHAQAPRCSRICGRGETYQRRGVAPRRSATSGRPRSSTPPQPVRAKCSEICFTHKADMTAPLSNSRHLFSSTTHRHASSTSWRSRGIAGPYCRRRRAAREGGCPRRATRRRALPPRGLVLRDLGQPKEAVAALRRAVTLAPALVQARGELSDLYEELDRGSGARELDALPPSMPAPSASSRLASPTPALDAPTAP